MWLPKIDMHRTKRFASSVGIQNIAAEGKGISLVFPSEGM